MQERGKTTKREQGFTLLEMMIALAVLSLGVLSLAAMLANSLTYMQNSENDFIAQQKAQEALEAIYTAKYDNTITFAQVANTSSTPPGIFLPTPQPLLQPGSDGLVGTSADSTATPAYIYLPGPDGLMGTADDITVPLSGFTRTITINTVSTDSNLKTITVTVNYQVGSANRTYTMNSYISAFN
jgi:prepilin-type N-terminal cleavage/methylation domain-containing protein